MKRCVLALSVTALVGSLWLGGTAPAWAAQSKDPIIIVPRDASWMETLAAREVRRYIYLRTGRLFPIAAEPAANARAAAIIIARKDRALLREAGGPQLIRAISSLAPQTYWIRTINPDGWKRSGRQALMLAGGDDAGVLYAAYRFAEQLGVRFYLHGDVVPDEQTEWKLPPLDLKESPLFPLRGIQPFHDFPEGPDWWNGDDYLAVIGQLPKLRMNFFGLHTYPERRRKAEPTVWIGLPRDFGPAGRVSFSYPSSWMNTLRDDWGYAPKSTSEYLYGSAQLFEREDFGPEVMFGAMPAPEQPDLCNGVFDHAAALLRDAFSLAHQLGVKTCVGTETPLIIPAKVQEHLSSLGKDPTNATVVQELYEGIFRRAAQAYPLDYYWFWTPEGWTWSGVKEAQIQATTNDLNIAIAAHKKAQVSFGLATCGWVLGPEQDRAMFDKVLPKAVALSCISRQVGYTPVDAGFAEVNGRRKWAIPWLEDDGALTSPQLWVGRMRRDAADALRYGCDGLMGIHWRTRILAPNVLALAQAAWDQAPWLAEYERAHVPAKQAFPSTADFYTDWALHEFGSEAGPAAARIFQAVDCALPKPSTWVRGPGGIQPDTQPWGQVQKEYAFVDEFSALRPQVKRAGERERFDYWMNTFLYFRGIGELSCAWGEYDRAMEQVRMEKDAAKQRALARELALPAREKLIRLLAVVYDHLLATVSTTGELGTVANWNQHILPDLLTKPGEELSKVLCEELPASAQPVKAYHGPVRVIVPTKRSSLAPGEALTLKVLILSDVPPRSGALYWRKLGEKRFVSTPLRLVLRGVYRVELPELAHADFEYYLQVEPERGQPICWPPTAPKLNQTLVITP